MNMPSDQDTIKPVLRREIQIPSLQDTDQVAPRGRADSSLVSPVEQADSPADTISPVRVAPDSVPSVRTNDSSTSTIYTDTVRQARPIRQEQVVVADTLTQQDTLAPVLEAKIDPSLLPEPELFTFSDISFPSTADTTDAGYVVRESLFSSHKLKVSYDEPVIRPVNQDWVFPSLLGVLFVFAFVRRVHFNKLRYYLTAAFARRIYLQLVREEGTLMTPVILWMGAASLVLWSIFIYQVGDFFDVLPDRPPGILILQVCAFMVSWFLVKSLLFAITGFLLNVLPVITGYLFTQLLYFSLSGLVLFPVVAFSEYLHLVPSVVILGFGIIIAAFMFIIRVQRGIMLAGSFGGLSGLYLFLYFCALELTPLFLLYKSISGLI